MAGAIVLIGAHGHPEDRRDGETQVLRLAPGDFPVAPVETGGDAPGWIHRHRAALTPDGIVVTGGKIAPGFRDRTARHRLDLSTWTWHRLDLIRVDPAGHRTDTAATTGPRGGAP